MRALALKLFFAILVLASGPVACLAGVCPDESGERHVVNGSEPRSGVRNLQLEELWRSDADDEKTLFGLISDVVADANGNLYVLDSQVKEITVLSPDGAYQRTIGRSGEGPGEFHSSFSLAVLPDGSIGVAQTFPGKLIGLKPDGTPRRNITVNSGTLGNTVILNRVLRGGDHVVICASFMTFAGDGKQVAMDSFIRGLDLDGKLGATYCESAVVLTPGGEFLESDFRRLERPYAVGTDGRVAVVPQADRYLYEVYDQQGARLLTVERENENWFRSDRARYFALTDMRMMGRGLGLADIDLEETEQEILDLQLRDDGTVWIRTGKDSYWHGAGEFLYDMFTEDGRYDSKCRIVVEGDANLDLLKFVGEDRVLLIRGFRDSLHGMGGIKRPWAEQEPIVPPGLICYRIVG